MGDIRAKFKSKKFKKNILIYFIIFVIIILLLNWLIKSQQTNRNKNEADNFNDYYKELLRQCGGRDNQLDDCCFASVQLMAASDFKIASGIGCEPGYKINTYKCLGSYKWCEMIR